MTEEEQKTIEQLFDAMGKSGGRFVIGQVVGSQKIYCGNQCAEKDSVEEPVEPIDIEMSEDEIIKNSILRMWDEGELKHLYDYTWVMVAMNDTKGLPNFDSPSSFVTYLASLGIPKMPSESSIKKKFEKMLGTFPDLVFLDADKTEANRRINVGKRFLKLYRTKGK